jgi:thiol-disulfide isomerase/thioredoxin
MVFSVGFISGFFSYQPIVTWMLRKQYQARQERFMRKPVPASATQTLDGKPWSLQDQRGKVVLINFWATWCAPCISEMPNLNALHSKYENRPDFLLVGVALDTKTEIVVQTCTEKRITWLQLHEKGKGWENSFARAFDVQFVPSTWLVDRDGRVIIFETTLDEIEATLAKVLEQGGEASRNGAGSSPGFRLPTHLVSDKPAACRTSVERAYCAVTRARIGLPGVAPSTNRPSFTTSTPPTRMYRTPSE